MRVYSSKSAAALAVCQGLPVSCHIHYTHCLSLCPQEVLHTCCRIPQLLRTTTLSSFQRSFLPILAVNIMYLPACMHAAPAPALPTHTPAAAAAAAAVSVLHEAKGPSLPANMLALMTELEKHGPNFASKMLITVLGEC
jgi:hypothetical protein